MSACVMLQVEASNRNSFHMDADSALVHPAVPYNIQHLRICTSAIHKYLKQMRFIQLLGK